MKIHKGKRQIQVKTKKVSGVKKFSGLMLKSRNTSNLLFEFAKWEPYTIHSFFVFFPFLAIWLDEKNRVLEHHLVRPFTAIVSPKSHPSKLIEVPLNEKNSKIIDFFVDKRKHLNI